MGSQVAKEAELEFEKDEKGKPVILGRGASGIIKLAKFNGKKVAVKYYRDFEYDEEMMKEAKQEKDLLGALKHPNIVEFIGYNFDTGFLLLEYIENGDLFINLQKPETRLDQYGWKLIIGIAEGLAFLHSKDILHLDLKSLNVLLGKEWQPKITDVGLSRKIQREKRNMSPQHFTLAAKFTTEWAPPENFQLPLSFSFKSDIYSFAIIMWEIITGERPWGDTQSWTVPDKVLSGGRPSIPETCPPELRSLIEVCWGQDPSSRPSAKEVVSALQIFKGLSDGIQSPSSNSTGFFSIPFSRSKSGGDGGNQIAKDSPSSRSPLVICQRCKCKYNAAENKKGGCVHKGKWHQSFSDCNIKCGLSLGAKGDLGIRHWSCCYIIDPDIYICPNSSHKLL